LPSNTRNKQVGELTAHIKAEVDQFNLYEEEEESETGAFEKHSHYNFNGKGLMLNYH